jgi:uncharacterized RDD family membrane protein YckC
MTEEKQQRWIASFWRRIGAIVLDSLVLGLVGFLLGLFLKDEFVQLGEWGRLVGFAIALIYFGGMNSKLCNGQTIGKKLLDLQVVDLQNNAISLSKSLLRYLVLAVPFSLNGLHADMDQMPAFLSFLLVAVVFGGILSVIYLYLFNRVTRQSLHDLVTGTLVVNAKVEEQEIGKVWKVHLGVVVALFTTTALLPLFVESLAQQEHFSGMTKAYEEIKALPGIRNPRVTTGTTTFSSSDSGTRTSTHVVVKAGLDTDVISDVGLARKLADIAISNYPKALDKDVIRVTLYYGYDIGIWSQWSSYAHDFNPREFFDHDKPKRYPNDLNVE